jgi:hypothetical protein
MYLNLNERWSYAVVSLKSLWRGVGQTLCWLFNLTLHGKEDEAQLLAPAFYSSEKHLPSFYLFVTSWLL